MTEVPPISELEFGQLYHFRFRSDARKSSIVLECVMAYTGSNGSSLTFSARPKIGTQTIPYAWIIEIEKVDYSSLVYVNWDRRSKKPLMKWRYRP
jgi:hypothetical protein